MRTSKSGLLFLALVLLNAYSFGQEESVTIKEGDQSVAPVEVEVEAPDPALPEAEAIGDQLENKGQVEDARPEVKTQIEEDPEPATENSRGRKNLADFIYPSVVFLIAVGILISFILLLLLVKKGNQLREVIGDLQDQLGENPLKSKGHPGNSSSDPESGSDLKASLNDNLSQITKYLQLVSESIAKVSSETQEAAAYTKQVSETLYSKEDELSGLRKGYQQSMIGPLVMNFISLRDDLSAIAQGADLSESLKRQLDNLNQSIGVALSEIGVNQLEIAINSDPLIVESNKWRALEATRPTGDVALDGAVAAVIKPGYLLIGPSGNEVVVRKAELVRYKKD